MRLIDPAKAAMLRQLAAEAGGNLEIVSEAIAKASHGGKDPSLEDARAELEKLKQEEPALPSSVW